jgi:hypothetical protein
MSPPITAPMIPTTMLAPAPIWESRPMIMLAIHPASAPNKTQKIMFVSILSPFVGSSMIFGSYSTKYKVNRQLIQ